MSRINLLLLMVLAACGERRNPPAAGARLVPPNDSAFAQIQARGRIAMGVDQYTSSHQFQSLPDGGRITLQREGEDSIGSARIRAHLREIAAAFAQGNFKLPGFVHDRPVPGTAIMAARRSRIRYTADSLPRGGSLRIYSTDSIAVAAIHQFLAFQRSDHRAHGQSD